MDSVIFFRAFSPSFIALYLSSLAFILSSSFYIQRIIQQVSPNDIIYYIQHIYIKHLTFCFLNSMAFFRRMAASSKDCWRTSLIARRLFLCSSFSAITCRANSSRFSKSLKVEFICGILSVTKGDCIQRIIGEFL